ncbi:MAG: TonB-dependent receptor plug domain-containing protein, partial [Candidatus Omnitrophota bacterium]
MRNLKRYGLVFLGVIGCLFPAFAQEERAAELERIVVSKDKGLFARAYSLGPGDLENLPFDSPVEALCVLPIDLQSRSPRAGIQTDFSLRGSNFQDVLILLDGKRINDPQTAHFNADLPFTSADIAGLRVLPSAPSSLFGPDAIGGAVDFIIRKPGEKTRVLKLSGGEYGFASQLFSIGDRFRELGFRLSVEHEQSSGFREDTDFKKFTASASAVSGLPLGEFNLKMGYQEKAFGAFDFYTPGLGYPSKEWTRTYLVDAGFDLEKDGLRIQPNFIWRRHFDKFALDKSLIRSSFIANHRNDTYTPGIY